LHGDGHPPVQLLDGNALDVQKKKSKQTMPTFNNLECSARFKGMAYLECVTCGVWFSFFVQSLHKCGVTGAVLAYQQQICPAASK
jgi:hypothetical protein